MVLRTMTGGRDTRRPLCETLLTRPSQVEDFRAEEVTTEEATLTWIVPVGHRKLRAFRIQMSSSDGEVMRELAVRHLPDKALNSFLLDALSPATSYQASIKTVCVFENLRTVSDEKSLWLVTLPLPPSNLSLENSSPTSLTVKWELCQHPPAQNRKFKLSIENCILGFSSEYSVAGDKNTFNFSKLPDVVGSGIIESNFTVL